MLVMTLTVKKEAMKIDSNKAAFLLSDNMPSQIHVQVTRLSLKRVLRLKNGMKH
jgi:hypothetical protein